MKIKNMFAIQSDIAKFNSLQIQGAVALQSLGLSDLIEAYSEVQSSSFLSETKNQVVSLCEAAYRAIVKMRLLAASIDAPSVICYQSF